MNIYTRQIKKNSQHVLECLKKYCPRIDKNRD